MILICLITFSICLTIWYCTNIIYSLYFSPLKDIPSPLIFQLIPFYFDILQALGNCPWEVHPYHLKYGTIFRVGWRRVLAVGPKAISTIYGGYRFDKSLTYEGFSYFGQNLLSTCGRVKHSNRRRLLNPAFTRNKLAQMESTIIESGVLPLLKVFEKASHQKASLNIFSQFHYFSCDVIGELVFGQSFNLLAESIHPIIGWIEFMMIIFLLGYSFPSLKRLRFETGLKMKEFCQNVMERYYIKHEKNQIKSSKEGTNTHITNILGHFVDAVDKETGKGLTRDEIFSESVLLLFAGSDTTSNTLTSIFYLIIKNPRVYKSIMEEINELGTDVSEKIINYETCQKLAYLEATIKEVMRYWPTVPGNTIRVVPKGGIDLLNHYLPEGTEVSVPIYSTHNSPMFWKKPDAFIPERWLNAEKNTDASWPSLLCQESYMPFSIGPRSCIGKDLALMEMMLVVANILFRYHLELDPEESNVELTALPILRPKNSRMKVFVTAIKN